MSPNEIYASMVRNPSLTLDTRNALLFLEQCANSWVTIKPEWNNRYVRLSRIQVPKDQQRKGYGTAIMQALCDVADHRGWILTLSPTMDFGATSEARLKRFYGRFGFVLNRGRKKDFDTQALMYRRYTGQTD